MASNLLRDLQSLREAHPTWRLLRHSQSAFIINFLHSQFIENQASRVSEPAFINNLTEHLEAARADNDWDGYPASAEDCLAKWASNDYGFVRRAYAPDSDEPMVELSPAANRAIDWILGLRKRSAFVGTESRLRTIIDLLTQVRNGTEPDPIRHLQELKQQRQILEDEILRISRGEPPHLLDRIQVRDRLQQIYDHARALINDLRDVEQNFRSLDVDLRRRIAAWDAPKGQLLSTVFDDSDSIAKSIQGQSFAAFWEYLISPERQEEFRALLKTAIAAGLIEECGDPQIRQINREWVRMAEQVQRTVTQISDQLRRFLDDRSRREDRRIAQLIQQFERTALGLSILPEGDFASLDGMEAEVELPMERLLFPTSEKTTFSVNPVDIGQSDDAADSLRSLVYVDPQLLKDNIARALDQQEVIGLSMLIEQNPLQYGLAELIGYLKIASDRERASITPSESETITWTLNGATRAATVPRVLFWR